MVTKGDVIAVSIIGSVTSCLSIFGSVAIITMLLRSEKKLGSTYRRLLFGMSAMDIIFSTSVMLGSTVSPKDTIGLWMPMGNQTTCTLQGWALYSGSIGLTFYNCSLCLYYYLSLVKNTQRDRMIQIERFFHAIPIAWILSTSSLLLSTESFNTFGIACMISSSPRGCDSNNEVECTRGINAKYYRWFFHLLPIILIFIIICASMTRICLSIRTQEQKMETYRANLGTLPDSIRVIRQARNASTCFDIEDVSRHTSRTRESIGDRLRRDACKQSLCHVFAYFLSYVFSMIFQGIVTFTGEVNVAIWILQQLTTPTQGLFNFIVFLRPRVITVRKNNPELSLLGAVRRTIKNNEEIQEVSRPFGSRPNLALSPRRESRRYTAREWHLKTVTEEKITEESLSVKIDTVLN